MSDLARELFGEGDAVMSGELTLDLTKARERLRKFRLTDPHLYVLQFVRAASVLGAKRIEFSADADELWCEFDATLPERILEDIWAVAFGARETTEEVAANQLALGLGSAQALRPEKVEVESGRGRLVVRDEHDEFALADEPRDGTSIYVQEKFRLGHLAEFFTTRLGVPAELAILWQYCALSDVEISFNGRPLEKAARRIDPTDGPPFVDRPPQSLDFAGDLGRGWVQIDPRTETLDFEVVKDGVRVGASHIQGHGRGARGVVHSRHVRTDISGLELVEDDAFYEVVNAGVMGAYHRMLLDVLIEHGDRAAWLGAAAEIFDYAHELSDWGRPPSDGTRELFDWLSNQRMFQLAVGDPTPVCPLDPISKHEIQFARSRFSLEQSQYPDVVLRDSGSGAALEAWAKCRGLKLTDVTPVLRDEERRRRNIAVWRAQPPRQAPDRAFQADVAFADAEAAVYLPIPAAVAPPDEPAGVRLHHEGKLLHFESWDLPIVVDIDGSFTVDFVHDTVVVDDTVRGLAEELLIAVPGLMEDYASLLVDIEGDSAARPRPLDVWLASLLSDQFVPEFLTGLGLSLEDVPDMRLAGVESLESIYGVSMWLQGWTDAPDGEVRREASRLLGSTAAPRSFSTLRGDATSLAEILESDETVFYLPDTPESLEFIDKMDRALGRRLDRPVLLVDQIQQKILQHLGGRAIDGREPLEEHVAEQQFLAQPVWEDQLPSSKIVWRVEGESGEDALEIVLLDGPPGESYAMFLHRDRVLRRRALKTDFGSFRAVVHCAENLSNLSGTAERMRMSAIVAAIRKLTHEAAYAWLGDLGARDAPPTGALRDVYFRVAARLLPEPGWQDTPFVPVVQFEDRSRTRRLASPRELRQMRERTGGAIPFTHTESVDHDLLPYHEVPVIDLTWEVPTSTLRTFWKQVVYIDVSATHHDDGSARRRYLAQPTALDAIPPGCWRSRLNARDLSFTTVLYREEPPHRPTSSARLRAFHQSRVLETFDIAVPFGRFELTADGDGLGPDPAYKHVAKGRADILELANVAIRNVILEAGTALADAHAGRGDEGDLEDVRLALLGMLVRCHEAVPDAPFDLYDELGEMELFETTTGRWLSYRKLETLAIASAIPYTTGETSRELLYVPPTLVSLYQSAVLPYGLIPSLGFEGVPTSDAEPVEGGELLPALSRVLVSARGERTDLLDDHLAVSLIWDDREDVADVCAVHPGGVLVRRDHPLVAFALEHPSNKAVVRYLASVIYTEINRFHREITDFDEIEMQRRMLDSSNRA